MKKIVCIIGTRPQMIKHSVLINSLKTSFEVETLNTQQHYSYELNALLQEDLFSNVEFEQLDLDPNHSPAIRLGEMIMKIGSYLQFSKPDAVLVYGDTDTTLAGALATKKCKYQLIHVESGERSWNNEMPEEQNRILTDSLADILFCSSSPAYNTLKKEKNKSIIFSGDIMKDLLYEKASVIVRPPIDGEYVYCTIHRNYNQNNPLKLQEVLNQLQLLGTLVIFPIHPATLKTAKGFGIHLNSYSNIKFLSPLSYSDSIHYQKYAKAVITDSGGIQKEAYWLKRPCITIRKETEWIETLKGNWNQLIYNDLHLLGDLIQNHPEENYYEPSLYGNGNASSIILENLSSLIN
jgi:UDP-GlcNAc3NAcA epimerase